VCALWALLGAKLLNEAKLLVLALKRLVVFDLVGPSFEVALLCSCIVLSCSHYVLHASLRSFVVIVVRLLLATSLSLSARSIV
jgi:hypothetical protein